MPYARPNRTSTTPRTPARRPRRAIVITGPQNPAVTISQATGGWNFAVRVWIAFDPPTAATPNWIDISGFVEMDSPITITRGRSDGLSDVNAGTCLLTVDNSDGRFSAANPAGAWYGQVHKGNWLKVEIYPPSGIVSSRFVGFITSLPSQWTGQYQYGQINAADRFEKLGQAPAIISSIQSEVLTDPNLAGSIQGYWNLHEPQGSTTFGDTSGQAARHMVIQGAGGVPAGIGFGASNVAGPGYDNLRAVSFNPVNTSTGTYLTAPITSPLNGTWNLSTGAYTGLYGTLEFWFQVPVSVPIPNYQVLASANDPVTSFGVTIVVSNHTITVAPGGTNNANNASYHIDFTSYPFVVDDGQWHHIIVGVAATNGGGGWASMIAIIDGVWCRTLTQTNQGAGGVTSGNFTQLIVGGAYNPAASPGVLYLGEVNIAEVAWYWSDLWNQTPANGRPPDALSHYRAGATGFVGESTDLRVARIARYARLPLPPTSLSYDSFNSVAPYTSVTLGQVQSYTPTAAPWLNLSPGAHLVGTQSASGRKSLDVMREAARTEGMPLFVDRSGYLTLQNSTIRQNTSPAWSVNALDLDPSTAVADDFAYLTNQMTVTPTGQAAQTVIGAPGSAGQLSQAKYGEYDGSQATASVNPVEAQSLGLGYIQLRADPAPRLAPLALEAATLALLPGYGSAWLDAVLATEISTPVRVTNAPASVGGGNYDVLIEGYTETITAGNLLLAFNISPVQGPTYQLDDAVLGRLDTDGSTLAAAVTSSATLLPVSVTGIMTGSAPWTAAPADMPFDVNIGGEQITVTAITSATTFGAADGTFESGVGGWTIGTGSALASSTAAAHSGTKSGLVSGPTSSLIQITSPDIAVTPGLTYTAALWLALQAGTIDQAAVRISWYDGTHTLISQIDSSPQVTATNVWTPLSVTQAAPANAAVAQIQFHAHTPGTDSAWIDDVTLMPQLFTVTRSVNGVVASHPAGTAVSLWSPTTLAY